MPVSDPILVFAILALAIMAAPLLANKLRVPDLVLLLIAGAALGPKGFGVLERNTAIELFGAVGLIYIMFLAGIEIDLTRFMRTRGRSIFFGLMTFSIPQGLGTLAGRYILHMDWPASILLASMFASHTLLAYPLASRLGISRTEPVAVTVGATIITDTLALLVLAVIADSARGITLGFGFWAGIVLGMTALVLLIWWGIPWLSRWFFKNFTEAGGAQFLFVLFVVCGCSYLSHFARMEPIIGAFLAGAAFNRQIPENSALMNRVVFAGNTLFIPFFLISVGMLVDPMALVNNPRSWIVVITMTAAVIVTKYMAAWVSRRKFGYGADAGKVMFGLSVVQAAATLAAVLVGYNLKIFDESVLNGAIGMILVTCPLGAWYVDRYGRKMAAEVQIAKEPERIEQRIVVPVAKPDSAVRLLDLAFLFRNHEIPGTIYPMTVVSDEADPDESLARAENLLALCVTHAASAEVNLNPIVRVDINVSDGISRAAKEMRAGMVLSGWSGDQKAGARIFGTVMSNLKTNCHSR
ncbi:MAG TPA: cation:proton antiporter, partial [Candidatus Sumerlaeota bacterium]|nr:cation:proton antiporter [Candidatus Sumerlaeota bacterium]